MFRVFSYNTLILDIYDIYKNEKKKIFFFKNNRPSTIKGQVEYGSTYEKIIPI